MSMKKILILSSIAVSISFLVLIGIVSIFLGGYSSARNALPSTIKGKQCDIFYIIADMIYEGKTVKVEEIKSAIDKILPDKNKRVYNYDFVNDKLVVSYYPYPWQKLYSNNPRKPSYLIDYYVSPQGKIIVFTYDVPHEHEWDKIGKDKDIMVTYSEKSVKDSDFASTREKHLHQGEYVSKDEFESIKKKMSDSPPPTR